MKRTLLATTLVGLLGTASYFPSPVLGQEASPEPSPTPQSASYNQPSSVASSLSSTRTSDADLDLRLKDIKQYGTDRLFIPQEKVGKMFTEGLYYKVMAEYYRQKAEKGEPSNVPFYSNQQLVEKYKAAYEAVKEVLEKVPVRDRK